jgi:hypothetical protein
MLPYLALKVAWLSGNPIRFNDASLVAKRGMIAANAISFGMDFLAVGLALALTHRWGLRVPAWLLLFPMWVASGFLAPAVLMASIVAVSTVITQASAATPVPATNVRLADVAAVMAVAAGGLYLAWAFGANVGLGNPAERSAQSSVLGWRSSSG